MSVPTSTCARRMRRTRSSYPGGKAARHGRAGGGGEARPSAGRKPRENSAQMACSPNAGRGEARLAQGTGAERTNVPRHHPAAAPEVGRADLYADVTARIICQLEAGRVPWVQPWGRAGVAAAGLPRNAATMRPYSGINILILWGALIEQGHGSQGWLTFRQAQAAGGCVRKGERGTTVVYADRVTPGDEAQRAREAGDNPRAVSFLKSTTV